MFAVLLAAVLPALVPQPGVFEQQACPGGGLPLAAPLRAAASFDPGGRELLGRRWRALGIAAPVVAANPNLRVTSRVSGDDAAYTLDVDANGARIAGANAEGTFDGLATLAQLPVRVNGAWRLPCVHIVDRPALRWRIVSDDISRGPFPTRAYFEQRIRELAALKINGYSPYLEGVFADPAHPYVAAPSVLWAADLAHLAAYAARFHVALIPEQQTFAHMHAALQYEALAPLAETPHGYLLANSDLATYAYLEPLLRREEAAAGNVPFFHLGVDEPVDLGRGRTARTPQVVADHIRRVAAVVARPGTRPVIWDDAIQANPAILALIPHDIVIATFHYGAEPSFARYIATVAGAGFDQFVSPGANNWNEIYPDLDVAYANEGQFLADGKAARVLGMLATVWHDDGESLYEATWAPLAFAAASAWQTTPVDRAQWHRQFARAFFGSDDSGFARDLDALAAIRTLLHAKPASDSSDYLFWADPFDAAIGARTPAADVRAIRLAAEAVIAQLDDAGAPPLNAAAARVMRLAAQRYDDLGRRIQIGAEVRALYADARSHASTGDDAIVYRDLNQAKYLCWELRD